LIVSVFPPAVGPASGLTLLTVGGKYAKIAVTVCGAFIVT
jgi:hypothetical protein